MVAAVGCALGCCGGGLVMDLCGDIPVCRTVMFVYLVCTRLPMSGRLELLMGAPIGPGCCCPIAIGGVVRCWRC